MRCRLRLLPVALLCGGVLLLSACDGDDEAGTEPPGTAVDPAPTDEDGGPAPDEQEAPDADISGPADTEPAEVLAAMTVPIDWVDGGELEMAVTGIEVAGELLRVAVMFTASLPLEAEDVAIGAVLEGNENAPGAPIRPELIDPVNLKAYELVTGGTRSATSVRLRDGAPRTLVFYYAAPRDDIETIDIQWSSTLAPLTDVPFPR